VRAKYIDFEVKTGGTCMPGYNCKIPGINSTINLTTFAILEGFSGIKYSTDEETNPFPRPT
jgi:hypothetical protein